MDEKGEGPFSFPHRGGRRGEFCAMLQHIAVELFYLFSFLSYSLSLSGLVSAFISLFPLPLYGPTANCKAFRTARFA